MGEIYDAVTTVKELGKHLDNSKVMKLAKQQEDIFIQNKKTMNF